MPLPTPRAVHVDSALTNISIAYLQRADHFAARQVFPNVAVEKQSDVYFEFDRGDFNRDEAGKRAPNAESAGGGYRLDSTASYFADVWAYHHDVPDQVLANADAAVPQMRAATELVMHKLLIRQEAEFASTYLTGGVWDNDFDGVASSAGSGEVIQWSDGSNSDPIGDIRGAKTTILRNTGFVPNTLVLGSPDVLDALVDHPDIVDRVKYSGGVGNTSPAMVNEQTLASLFNIDRVIVSRAIENTAAEGASDSHSFIGGKTALLCYSAPNPGIMVPTAGYMFSWRNYLGAANDMGVATRSFRLEEKRCERVEGEIALDMKLVSSAMGYFWDSIVA
jgi:hypothetical protein